MKYVSILGFIYCLYGSGGNVIKYYPLWINSMTSEGEIIAYKTTHIRHSSSGSSFGTKLPIVTFKNLDGKLFETIGHYGQKYSRKRDKVLVIYDANNPSDAMIDEGFINNWLGLFIFLFGMIVFFLGIKRFSNLTNSREESKVTKLQRIIYSLENGGRTYKVIYISPPTLEKTSYSLPFLRA